MIKLLPFYILFSHRPSQIRVHNVDSSSYTTGSSGVTTHETKSQIEAAQEESKYLDLDHSSTREPLPPPSPSILRRNKGERRDSKSVHFSQDVERE
jgi:hypothetical protein